MDLWFTLAHREWSCLAITPADPDGSVDDLARALADAGQHLCEHPVSAVTSEALWPESVRALASLASRFQLSRPGPQVDPFQVQHLLAPHPRGRRPFDEEPMASAGPERGTSEEATGPEVGHDDAEGIGIPAGQLIIALPSVLSQPLAIAVARATQGVILVVEQGVTRLADLSRTVEAIGRDHVIGTCLVSPESERRR